MAGSVSGRVKTLPMVMRDQGREESFRGQGEPVQPPSISGFLDHSLPGAGNVPREERRAQSKRGAVRPLLLSLARPISLQVPALGASLGCLLGSVQFSSVAQSCLTLCDPMNRTTPGLPVHHQLPEFTQTHAHRVGDAIQPSHPLSSPSPPAPNPSQHQGLFQRVSSSHESFRLRVAYSGSHDSYSQLANPLQAWGHGLQKP